MRLHAVLQLGQVGHLALPHLLHELLHLLACGKELVDRLHRRAAAARDPLAARAVDHVRQRTLARCHRQNDRLDARELLVVDIDDRELGRVEAIVLSMTAEERRKPEIINGARRARIAAGSGTTVQQVNKLLQARKQMEKMIKQMGRGKTPNLQSIVAQQRR